MIFSEEALQSGTDTDQRTYQVVGNSLLERIQKGEFRLVGKLPPHRELAEAYGVGRAVIGDALVMLEVKGFIQSRHGSGIYITRRAYEVEALEPVTVPTNPLWDNLPPAGPFEVLQARQWIESQVARLAAINATEQNLVAIEQAYNDHCETPPGAARENYDRIFHLALASATQNPELVGVVGHLWQRRDNNPLWQNVRSRDVDLLVRDRWVKDHGLILDAMRRRDGEGAYVAMWQHIENVKNLILRPGDIPEIVEAKSATKRKSKLNR